MPDSRPQGRALESQELRFFEAVARLGDMNWVAEELNTVQSNVSTRIRALEEELGTALFQRHSKGVTLTGVGQHLLPFAVQLQHLSSDAERAVTADGEPQGLLLADGLETTAAIRLSRVLSIYASRYPK